MATKLIDLGSSTPSDGAVETIDIFKLDGKTYSAPKKISAGLSLKYLEKQAEEGPDSAIYFMFIELLGRDAFDALKNHPTLEKNDLDAVMKVVENLALADESGK